MSSNLPEIITRKISIDKVKYKKNEPLAVKHIQYFISMTIDILHNNFLEQ